MRARGVKEFEACWKVCFALAQLPGQVLDMNVLQSNLLFGDPKSGFELGVACRPSSYGGSFLLIDFCDPTAEFVDAM